MASITDVVGNESVVEPLNERGVISIRGEAYRALVNDGTLHAYRGRKSPMNPSTHVLSIKLTDVGKQEANYVFAPTRQIKLDDYNGTTREVGDELYEVALQPQSTDDVVTLKRVEPEKVILM